MGLCHPRRGRCFVRMRQPPHTQGSEAAIESSSTNLHKVSLDPEIPFSTSRFHPVYIKPPFFVLANTSLFLREPSSSPKGGLGLGQENSRPGTPVFSVHLKNNFSAPQSWLQLFHLSSRHGCRYSTSRRVSGRHARVRAPQAQEKVCREIE